MKVLRGCVMLSVFLLCLSACGQVDMAVTSLERSQSVAAELKDIVGVQPSVSVRWESREFSEVLIEFDEVPPGLPIDLLVEQARAAVSRHFESSPRQLKLSFDLGPD